MNDSKLRKELVQIATDSNGLYDDLKPEWKQKVDQVMELFNQAITARLDAVAGALPEKYVIPQSDNATILYMREIGFNEALAACHAAIDTVREGL